MWDVNDLELPGTAIMGRLSCASEVQVCLPAGGQMAVATIGHFVQALVSVAFLLTKALM